MTKQEEIREMVITNIAKACPKLLGKDIVTLADKIIRDEASQGVVIKVDKKLPELKDYSHHLFSDTNEAVFFGQYSMRADFVDAGYVAVEPLIKEEK